MDGSQITGASSSYARKYALNGLFCIDDNKDSDSTNTHEKVKSSDTNLSTAQIKRLYTLAKIAGYDKAKIEQMISTKYKKDIKALTKAEYDHICNGLEGKK